MDVGEKWGRWSCSPTSALGICARSGDLSKGEKLGDKFNSVLEVSEVQPRPVPTERAELLP